MAQRELKGKITKTDIFVCIICAVLVLLSFFTVTQRSSGKIAVIEVMGREYARYELNSIKTPQIVEIETELGYNKVVIQADGVYVAEADCRDKIDVRTGKITKTGQTIVCLPHRLVVTLCGEGERIDAASY